MSIKNIKLVSASVSAAYQRGVVLFLALVALVVMSLAAVALIRGVDTSTLIAGNLSAKQSATASADAGLETAMAWMAAIANVTTFDNDDAANGYYSTQATDPTSLNWDATDSLPATSTATGADAIVNGTDANGKGNTTRYIIQRMCRNSGPPSSANCLYGAPVVSTSSTRGKNETEAGAHATLDQSPIYRVTARVVGSKNTVSFIQAFVY